MKYLCVFFLFSLSSLFCLDLVPNTPVPISLSGSASTRASVAANSKGFMTVWTESNYIYYSVTTDNGQSWSAKTALPINHSVDGAVCVAGNESGFVIAWKDVSTGGVPSQKVIIAYTSDMGATWSEKTFSADVTPPPSVSATDAGFLVSWWNGVEDKIQTSFSSDGVNWSTIVNINPGTHNPIVHPNSVGYSDNFLVTYEGSNGSGLGVGVFIPSSSVGVSSFSSNRGANWSPVSEIEIGAGQAHVLYPGYYNNVFMVTWNDSNPPGGMGYFSTLTSPAPSSGIAYFSTSTNQGTTWSSALPITDSATLRGLTGVSILGTSKGFFVGVHFDDDTGGVAYSTDNGQSWSSFTQVTTGSDMGSVDDSILSMANNNNGIMTVWIDTSMNVYSAFIPVQFAIPVAAPQSLKGKGNVNMFPGQKQVYNFLQWAPSTTEGLDGYKIYRDGEFLMSTKNTSYQDFTVKPNKNYEYVVIAYTGDSISDPATVKVTTP